MILFIYLAVLGLRGCPGFSLIGVSGVALQLHVLASHCSDLSGCGAWALGARASAVMTRGLCSCSSRALEHRLGSIGTQA